VYLPDVVKEYNADGTSVYRSLETEYSSYNFTWHRMIGLPRFSRLYEGDAWYGGGVLKAQSELVYSGFQMRATHLVRLRPRRQNLAGVSP
jgi:hypothetical protein